MSDMWTELYPAKNQRVEHRQKGPYFNCQECGQWLGHRADCSEVTKEDLARLVKRSQHEEELVRKQAARYLQALQVATGKIAMLKNELRILRKRLKERG